MVVYYVDLSEEEPNQTGYIPIDISSGYVKLLNGVKIPLGNFSDNTIYLMTNLKDENIAETYQKMYSPSGLYFDRYNEGLVYS